MYEYMIYVFVIIFMILGGIMAINPKMLTKKQKRENIEEVKSTRRNGICVVVLGIILLVVSVLKFYINV